MLTAEIINQNIQGLTEDQVNAFLKLNDNDFGSRIGEVYRRMDETISQNTGVSRQGDEKTYNYLARAMQSVQEKLSQSTELTKQLDALKQTNADLEKKIAEGIKDEDSIKALKKAQADLLGVQEQYNVLKGEYDKAKESHAKELFDLQIGGELRSAASGIKFKSELPQSVTDVILNQAIAKVKGMNPVYADNNGVKTLIFQDSNGATLRNPENSLNAYTAGELLMRELKAMQVLDEGRKGAGAGTKPNGNQPSETTVDLSAARNQVEAMGIIENILGKKGLVKGSNQYQQMMDAMWKENNVSSLPQR